MKNKQIKMETNTAYLLNTWFCENSLMFPKVKLFIKNLHKEMWKGSNKGFIEVIFNFVAKKSIS